MLVVALFGAEQASGATPIDSDSVLSEVVGRIRDMSYTNIPQAAAAAESLLKDQETRYGGESHQAYTARELFVECRYLVRYRPDPEICELAQRILDYRIHTATPDSANMVRALQLSARCAHRTGRLEPALALQRRAIAIQERIKGPDAYEVSTQLNALGAILGDAGRYGEMRTALERAIAIRLKTMPPDSTPVVLLRNNLAVAHEAVGDYSAALPLYEDVLATYLRKLGPASAKTGYALNNVAVARAATGDRKRARELFEQALVVREATSTKGGFDVAETLTNLGDLLLEDGEASRARELLQRALALEAQAVRPDHRYRIQTLLSLATVSRSLGEFDEARRLAREALSAVEQGQGPDHHEAARALVSLAETELAARAPAAAVPPLDRALAILVRVLGDASPQVARARSLLAEALVRTDDPRALPMALEAERVAREYLRYTFRVLPEHQAMSLRAQIRGGLDLAIVRLAGSPTRSDSAVSAVWDALVRSRGLVLDEIASRIHLVPAGDTTVTRLGRAFLAARQREVNLAVRGPRDDSTSAYRARLEDARREADDAEGALARRSAPFREHLARGGIGLSEVRRALPGDAALVAFARHETPGAPAGYAAFVVRAGSASPSFVPLGPAGEIDSLVARWRDAARRWTGTPAAAEAEYDRVAAALRSRVWDPLVPAIGRPLTAYLIPDGALALVNFATLPADARTYLVERGPTFRYLTTERDMVAETSVPHPGGQLMVAVGGVDYDADPGAPPTTAPARDAKEAGTAEGAQLRGVSIDCPLLQSLRFEALPQSRAEIEDVRALWSGSAPGRRVRTLSGGRATEEAFRELAPRSRILHLATHGFFLSGACDAESAAVSMAGETHRPKEDLDLPLVRSGLALAGANTRLRKAVPGDDGILTAAEVAALDLEAVDAVVLSGCETGLGTPADLEGLLGLRRAFQVAGAKTLVMSLWGVEDAPARRWMRAYYEARLTRGRSTASAARDAALALLAAQRAAGLGGHPAAWGAFASYGGR